MKARTIAILMADDRDDYERTEWLVAAYLTEAEAEAAQARAVAHVEKRPRGFDWDAPDDAECSKFAAWEKRVARHRQRNPVDPGQHDENTPRYFVRVIPLKSEATR